MSVVYKVCSFYIIVIIQRFNFRPISFPITGVDTADKHYNYRASVSFDFDESSCETLSEATNKFTTEAEFKRFEKSIQRACYMNASSYEHTSLASLDVPAVRIKEGEKVDFILPDHYLNAGNHIAFSMNYLGGHKWAVTKARIIETY